MPVVLNRAREKTSEREECARGKIKRGAKRCDRERKREKEGIKKGEEREEGGIEEEKERRQQGEEDGEE